MRGKKEKRREPGKDPVLGGVQQPQQRMSECHQLRQVSFQAVVWCLNAGADWLIQNENSVE